ncbi:uncharacterized protein J3D65DRAFT_630820 [Phyllosticta citribraziliensis]|uniref:Uncharacterized protein n=1 Tax=Phyllosticta citribraziliensis TaxID=989973 RepID=A0ABR1LJF7_9PEZI
MFKSPPPHVTSPSPRVPAHSLFKPLGRASQTSLLDVPTAEEPLPRAAECAVHLELLEVLHTTKSRCTKSHIVAHALNLRQPYSFGVVTKRKRSARAQAAWNTYLTLAVLRFGKWWDAVVKILDAPDGAVPQITKKTLPPLDVLMVWHTYLLTPQKYQALCRDGHESLLQMEFPWKAVHRAIDASTNTYQLTAEAQDVFQQKTGLEADLLSSLQRDKIHDTLTRTFLEKLAQSHLPDANRQQQQPFSLSSLGVQPYEYTPLPQAYEAHHHALAFLLPAIHRQETFWEKMATQNWLRSPAAARTLHHAVLCYHRFLLLFALHPAATLVPTLLIDVAWHTALCSPARYAATSRAFAGRFINHDDAIDDDARGDAWRDTQALYKQAFGDDYDVCRCWWCEVWLEEKEAATPDADDDDDRISERAAVRMERAMQAEKARMKTARR